MKKDEWDSWLALVWGHSIKRNALVRTRFADRGGRKELVGKILGATQESVIISLFHRPYKINYKRLRSIEKVEYTTWFSQERRIKKN